MLSYATYCLFFRQSYGAKSWSVLGWRWTMKPRGWTCALKPLVSDLRCSQPVSPTSKPPITRGFRMCLTICGTRTKIEHGKLRINTTTSSAARNITGTLMPARTTPSYLNFDQSGLSLEVRHRLPRPSQTLSRRQGRAGRPHLRTLQERDCAPLAL